MKKLTFLVGLHKLLSGVLYLTFGLLFSFLVILTVSLIGWLSSTLSGFLLVVLLLSSLGTRFAYLLFTDALQHALHAKLEPQPTQDKEAKQSRMCTRRQISLSRRITWTPK